MAKAKLDFKKLLLERGERIGLSVAGIITLLLLLISLLWPGKGVFSGSPEEKAKGLTEPAAYINQRLSDPNNTPGEDDMPAKNSNEKLIALEMSPIEAEKFRMASLIPADGAGSQGRRAVRVLGIDDAVVKLARMQIQTYVMDANGNIYVLIGKENSAKGGQGERFSKMMGRGGMGMGGSGKGMAPPGGMRGFGPPKGMGGGGGEEKSARRLMAMPLAKLATRNDATPAEQIRPLRMAIIAASFPYKAQVEEFRSKLALRSANEVLAEQGLEKIKVNGKERLLPSFHFTGVEVERRELDGDGKPVAKTGDGWTKLELQKQYQPWVILSGARFEEDDPDLKAISFRGLVMPRLQGFRPENVGKGEGATGGAGAPAGPGAMRPPMGSGAPPGPGAMRPPMGSGATPGSDGKEEGAAKHKDLYPPVEKELPEIRKTLEAIKGKAGTEVLAPPTQFQGIGDIFDPTSPAEPKEKDAGTEDKTGDGKTDPDAVREIPEHCLVRVIDIDIVPGKTYEYRLRVKMLNPNYKRPDVVSPEYAKNAELPSEWSKKTVRVQVEPELRYYAVDQKKLYTKEMGKYDGPNGQALLNEDKEVWIQADRWVERTRIRPGGDEQEVGEWTVAERFKATRGEYVGRPVRIQLPVWKIEPQEFAIADDFRGKGRSSVPSIEVDFGYGPNGTATQPEAIAVDFRGTKHTIDKIVKRNEDGAAPTTAKVSDESAAEVLLLDPNGRLRLLEGALDATDPKREERRLHARERVREITHGGKKAGDGGTGKPFDK